MLLVLFAYAHVRNAGYIWDDDVILTANPTIVGPLGFKEIWTEAGTERDFAPLTRTTFWLEHQLWGLRPAPYHVVNVLLQGICALLLWRVLLKLGVFGAWFGAAVWAIHPVQVESVAWVAEMKNTESGIYFLLTILFFLKWLRNSESGENTAAMRDCILLVLFAASAMLCKASTVILPVVLCLCAWWVEDRLRRRCLLAVLPIFAMSAVVILLSMAGQQVQMHDAATFQQARSWPERIISAGNAVWFYLGKLIWPQPLAAVYPQWHVNVADLISYLPAVAVLAVLAMLWAFRRSGTRPFFLAFAYFVIALLPVLGLAENTIFRYSFVFDHLQYLASMGPLALVGAGAGRIWNHAKPENRWLPIVGGALLLAVLGIVTWQRTLVYLSPESYWADAVAKNPDSWMVHYNLGDAMDVRGDSPDALAEYRKARDLKPASPAAYDQIGSKLANAGLWNEAAASYRDALVISPNYFDAQLGLALALYRVGQLDEAITGFRIALKTKPDDASAHANLGAALFAKDRLDEAISEYQRAIALNPNVAFTHDNFALALLKEKQTQEAIAEYQKTLELDAQFPDGHYDLGKAFLIARQYDAAIGQFQAALALDPKSVGAHNNLGIAFALLGQPEKAVVEFERVLQLKPSDADAEKNLALARTAAAKVTPTH